MCLLCLPLSLQAATCANTKPISAAGTAFTCPNNKEFDPARADVSPVNENSCCSKVRA